MTVVFYMPGSVEPPKVTTDLTVPHFKPGKELRDRVDTAAREPRRAQERGGRRVVR